jgi:hypothetical protein
MALVLQELRRLNQRMDELVKASKPRDSKRLLSQAEAARRLGVCPDKTLPKLIAQRQLKPVMVNGKPKIPAAQVEQLALQGFDTSAPVTPRPVLVRQSASPGAAVRALKLR